MFPSFQIRITNISFPLLRHTIHALVAIVAVLAPVVVAFDRGSVWAWDVWLLGVIGFVLAIAAAAGQSTPSADRSIRTLALRWSPLMFLLALAGLALFQTVDLPAGLVRWLSPASADAFGSWLPLATGNSPPRSHPISIDRDLTLAAAVQVLVIAGFAYVGGRVFANRHFVVVLLAGLALAGIVHSAAGFYQRQTTPGVYLFGAERLGQPFGAFVNRNNAGAMLNLGLAGAVGLIALRIHQALADHSRRLANAPAVPPAPPARHAGRRGPAVRHITAEELANLQSSDSLANTSAPRSPHPVPGPPIPAARSPIPDPRSSMPDPHSPWRDFTHLFHCLLADRLFWLAFAAGLVTVAAIIAAGSRGALVGAAAGTIACLAIAVPARRALRFAGAAVAVFFVVLISLDQLGISAESLDRLSDSEFGVLQGRDGRFEHWPDAMRAANAYLPMGAGLGGYRYGYMPFQETSGGGWALNADNQWVEWWLEGGLVMLLLLAAVIAAGVAHLRRLFAVADTIDRGLATAALFALVAILVSQTFDFALTHASIAILATLLAAAVAARAISDEARESVTPLNWRSRAVRTLAMLACIALTGSAIPLAKRQAASEAVVLSAEHRNRGPLTLQRLMETDGMLARAIVEDPENPRLLTERAQVRMTMFRAAEALRRATEGPMALRRAYAETDLSRLRAEQPSARLVLAGQEHLSLARVLSHEALRLSPLDDTARWNLVLTDFGGQDAERTGQLLRQLARLRSGNGDLLARVATEAAATRDWETARSAWRQALIVSPAHMRTVLAGVRATGGAVKVDEVVPDQRESVMAAAELELAENPQHADKALLSRAAAALRLPISQRERELKSKLETPP